MSWFNDQEINSKTQNFLGFSNFHRLLFKGTTQKHVCQKTHKFAIESPSFCQKNDDVLSSRRWWLCKTLQIATCAPRGAISGRWGRHYVMCVCDSRICIWANRHSHYFTRRTALDREKLRHSAPRITPICRNSHNSHCCAPLNGDAREDVALVSVCKSKCGRALYMLRGGSRLKTIKKSYLGVISQFRGRCISRS